MASASTTVMAGAIISPVLNPMGEGLGVSPAWARLIITTHGIFIALCSPLIGILIDRVGAKKPLIFGLILYGLSGAAGLFITSYWLLIVSRIIIGIGISAIFTSITVLILNLYEGQQRNNVMGWRASSNSFGGVFWPLLGGYLGTFSWHTPFAAYLIGIPLGILVFLTIPDKRKGVIKPVNAVNNKESVLRIVKNTRVLYITYGLTFLTHFFLYANVVFVPQLVERFGTVNPFHIGILLSTSGLTAAITSIAYGRIKAILSYKSIIIIVMLIWVAGATTMSRASSTAMVGLAMVLYGFGMGAMMPTAVVWTGESVPASFRGRITSYLATFGYVGQFLSPVILSPIASLFGLNTVFIIIAGISALLFFGFVIFLREKGKS